MPGLVFKTRVGREERPGCVRFAHASATNRQRPPPKWRALRLADVRKPFSRRCYSGVGMAPEGDEAVDRYFGSV